MSRLDDITRQSMRDAGIPEDKAEELIAFAKTAGMTSSGAETISVVRQGPATWCVAGEGDRPAIVVHTPGAVLLEVAKLLHGESHQVADVEITYAPRKRP